MAFTSKDEGRVLRVIRDLPTWEGEVGGEWVRDLSPGEIVIFLGKDETIPHDDWVWILVGDSLLSTPRTLLVSKCDRL